MKKLFGLMLLITMLVSANIVFAQVNGESSIQVYNTVGKIDSVNENSITVSGEGVYDNIILNVNDETHILNGETGKILPFSALKKGADVSAYYDGRMTKSIPPIGFAKAVIVGNADEIGMYMEAKEVEQLDDGVRVLCTNNDRLVTVRTDVLANAKDIAVGDELIVWYKAMTLSLPGQATAEKAVILNKKADITVYHLDHAIVIKGEKTPLELNAMIDEQKTVMVPLRQIAAKFGYTVTWKADSKSIDLQKGAQSASLTIGSYDYGKNKMRVVLENTPQIIDGNTFVPADFFDKVLDLKVKINK